jgi:hypothetical protein
MAEERSVPTTWRTLSEIATGGPETLGRITVAVAEARCRAWAAAGARHGGLAWGEDRGQGAGGGDRSRRTENPALQVLARRRPADPQRAMASAENLQNLALGRDSHRLDPPQRPATSP